MSKKKFNQSFVTKLKKMVGIRVNSQLRETTPGTPPEDEDILLKIDDLTVTFEVDGDVVQAVTDVTLEVKKGKTLGLVGETGAGKTTTALAALNMVPDPPGIIHKGHVWVCGENILTKTPAQLEMIRGTDYLCSIMNEDPNIIAKGGANGVYGFGLKEQRLGIGFKFVDGTEAAWPFMIIEILKALGALKPEHEKRLNILHPTYFVNDNEKIVGERRCEIKITI